MTYGAECWAVRKKDENRLHVAEMRMLRWIRGKTMSETRSYKRMPNVNIPETEKIKLAWTHQGKRRRQPLKKNYGHGCTGEEKKGAT